MRREAHGDPRALQQLLQEFRGIGPTGADIFIQEVQVVWPEFAPFIDRKVRPGAAAKRLPTAAEELARRRDAARYEHVVPGGSLTIAR